jgi:tRNA threonylcarbamoyladenosine biosynthesis protein TsaB
MNILAIDTAATKCSVMLVANGQRYICREQSLQMHSRHILRMIDDVLLKAMIQPEEIQLLAWNAGPGSFTGLRVAASVVQSLSYSFGLPVVSLSSLEVLAQGAQRIALVGCYETTLIHVATDARMNGVYWTSFICDQGVLRRTEPDQLLSKAAVAHKINGDGGNALYVGNGWQGLESKAVKLVLVDAFIEDVVALALTKAISSWENSPSNCLPNYIHGAISWQKRKLRAAG